jgi:hypothetical protein
VGSVTVAGTYTYRYTLMAQDNKYNNLHQPSSIWGRDTVGEKGEERARERERERERYAKPRETQHRANPFTLSTSPCTFY